MNSQNEIKKKKLLIFIVAYNAEKTIESVLKRIPVLLAEMYEVEILVIDDSSQDKTFAKTTVAKHSGTIPFKMTVLFNPVNQGYGGNQKIGFHYAVVNNFDWVALVHGDGQYAPECLPELLEVLDNDEADAVFGSRMMEGASALKGGMPLYKFLGNKTLTWFQNLLLGSSLSEFHSGYRIYSTDALRKIPFEMNSYDFHFDTEIIIQLLLSRQRIKELPIPTFYGDEVCHVNGIKYAWDVCWATVQSQLQKIHIFYDKKFDCIATEEKEGELDILSPESMFANSLKEESRILVLGNVRCKLGEILSEKGHHVTSYNDEISGSGLSDCGEVDYIVVFDDANWGQNPDAFIQFIRKICLYRPNVKLVLLLGNVGFFITRILLLLGRFSYTKKGIISFSNYRLFTLKSCKKLLLQNNFSFIGVTGVPIPFYSFFHKKYIGKLLSSVHLFLCKIRPSLFAYQFLIEVKNLPSLEYLLLDAIQMSKDREKETLEEPQIEVSDALQR